MPLIKPRTRGKQFIRLISRLDRENNETLHAYAHFIGESAEYVLNQLLETVLAKDKEFTAWRAEHPDSYVPLPRRQQQPVKVAHARAASLTHAAAASGVAG
jgi:hypothetical protein